MNMFYRSNTSVTESLRKLNALTVNFATSYQGILLPKNNVASSFKWGIGDKWYQLEMRALLSYKFGSVGNLLRCDREKNSQLDLPFFPGYFIGEKQGTFISFFMKILFYTSYFLLWEHPFF